MKTTSITAKLASITTALVACALLNSCAIILGTADAVYSVTSATISAGATIGGAVIDAVSDDDKSKK